MHYAARTDGFMPVRRIFFAHVFSIFLHVILAIRKDVCYNSYRVTEKTLTGQRTIL